MPCPRVAGLSFASVLSILAVGAFALPIGQPEPKPVSGAAPASSTIATASPDLPEVSGGERSRTAEPLRLSPALREAVGGTNALTLNAGRRKTLDNLGSIRLTLSLDNVPLGLVVDQLTEVARSQSSGTKAIRFTITNTVESSGSGTTPASNPANILISINRMQDATLLSVVDAIVRSAHPSLKWTVVEDGVAFSTRQPDNPSQLFARIIKIDPQSFLTEVRRVFTSAPPGVSGDVQQTVRAFFSRSGLDLSPPKQVFFDEREGNLVIRGTLADLDAIENAIGNLGTGQEQIHIKAAFLEFSEELLARFWSSQGITNAAEAETLSILTPFQQRRAREFLNSNSGVHLLNEASVTTLSGRQTMIQLVDLMPVLTNINPRALSHPGVPANGEGTNALYLSDSRPCGPTLELLPDLRADGFNIQLGATTTTHEFLGYDKPTNSVAVFVEGKRQRVELPVPRFRSRSATAAAVVRDGQTLLLKGLSSENVTKYKDKVPVLGDLPLVGTLFRSESTKREKKHLLVMITPTLVDPAGNRLHTDEQVEKAAAIQRWRQEWLPE